MASSDFEAAARGAAFCDAPGLKFAHQSSKNEEKHKFSKNAKCSESLRYAENAENAENAEIQKMQKCRKMQQKSKKCNKKQKQKNAKKKPY